MDGWLFFFFFFFVIARPTTIGIDATFTSAHR